MHYGTEADKNEIILNFQDVVIYKYKSFWTRMKVWSTLKNNNILYHLICKLAPKNK